MENLNELIKCSKQLKLLYVEDNDNAREATLMIFEEFFSTIVTAINGADALEKFDESFDLIITDINMPKMNGLDMIKIIRENNKEIPILVLSAHNESGFFLDSIKLGVDGYLLKPIDIEQFLSSLNKIISKVTLANAALNNLNLLKQYQEVTDMNAIVSKTDLNGNITYVNNTFCNLCEYSRDELIGKNHNIIRHPNNSKDLFKEIWNTVKTQKSIWNGTIKNISKTGKTFYLKTTIKPILDLNGEILEYISIKNDITDVMNQERLLLDIIDFMDEPIIVLIKIERFEDIKKYYGTLIASKVENEFFKRFSSFLPIDFTYRKLFSLGNGKFLILKENDLNSDIKSENKLKDDILEIQSIISHAVLDINEIDYDIFVSISLAYKDSSYENAKYGLKELFKTKQDFIIANDLIKKQKEEASYNLKTLKMIKNAIDKSRIFIYFQDIVDNNTKEISKYEVLVRLINEDGKVLTPYHFLNIAKKAKYYSQITQIVLKYAFEALNKTSKDISINLSALDIEKNSTQDYIFELLEEYSSKASRIVFELLEDEEMKDFNLIKKFIIKVKSYGVKIAIDDFGAGYSNFERLLYYKPDILKIDGCLVKNIHKDAYSLNVVETIVAFAKKQNIKTVGEFVENEEIYNVLKRIGVDYSQGYYFSEPKALKEENE